MSPVNLGTARIVLLVALVVGGIAVLANGFAGGTVVTAPGAGASGGTTTPPPTGSPTTTPKATPSPQVDGVLIQVFNGTYSPGLAGQVQQMLVKDGYVAAATAADAPSKPVAKTVVYFRGGADAAQNRSNAKYLAGHYLNGAKVAVLGADQASTVAKNAQIAIVLGLDYVAAHG
jgi:hypothetical protein